MAEEHRQPYGAWLREARKARGLSLKEVSDVIRIDEPYLQALESGNIAILPEPYIRAFLKTYASHLGLNPEEALRRIEEFIEEQAERLESVRSAVREQEGKWYPDGTREILVPAEAGRADAEEEQARLPRKSQMAIAAAVILFIAIVVFLAIRLTGDVGVTGDPEAGSGGTASAIPTGTPALPEDERSAEPIPGAFTAVTDTASEQETPAIPRTTPATPGPTGTRRPASGLQLLVAEAIETTWMQAVTDGDTIVSRTVVAGRTVRIPFRDTLVVKAGKNHGMRFLLNGVEVTGLGSPGMVLSRLVLTRNGVVSRRLTQPPGQEPWEPRDQVTFRQHR
jgi:transcriptional regulator with XRE-family HTH domain